MNNGAGPLNAPGGFEGEPEVRPYGIGVLMTDLYGNKTYINQD